MATTTQLLLPEIVQIKNLLADTLGKKVTISAQTITDKSLLNNIGIFSYDDGSIAYLCVADLPAAASLGAALTWMPKGVVEDSIKDKELSGLIKDNFSEVLNICTRLQSFPIQV